MNTGSQFEGTARSLRSTQRWLQSAIMRPGAADQSPSLLAGSPSLSAAQRLGIYQFAYQTRLCECLENEFPVLRRTVGDDAFRQLAVGYIRQHPSTSYTLGRLSERFIDYLQETRPPRSNTAADVPDWADYVIDVATLEHTINQVFDGPGAESGGRVAAEDLSRIAPSDWPHIAFECDPSLRLLELRFAVQSGFRTVPNEAESRRVQHRQTWLAVFRRAHAVRWQSLSVVDFTMLRSLAAGRSLGEAIFAAMERDTVDEQRILDGMSRIASMDFLLGPKSASRAS